MRALKVPFVEALDGCDLSGAAAVFELHARRASIDVLNWAAAFPYRPVAVFDIARGAKDLYIHYFVRGLSLRAVSGCDGAHVHPDSCVEFFMRRDGEMNYLNFEFNCIGTCYSERHRTRTDSAPLTADEFRSIRRHASLPREVFAERKGIFAWELTVAIPFGLMELEPARLPERIFGNFCKCADATENPHYATWNPVDLPQPNFHCPEFFGEIYF